MKKYLGILIMVLASICSGRILWAASVGNSEVLKLTEVYGHKTSFEWYSHSHARSVFHGEHWRVAEILYGAQFVFFPIVLLVGFGFLLALINAVGRFRWTVVFLGLVAAGITFSPWILYGDSIEVVASVVE